eukprot:1184932-Prorocentrum_minimum.AAC.1
MPPCPTSLVPALGICPLAPPRRRSESVRLGEASQPAQVGDPCLSYNNFGHNLERSGRKRGAGQGGEKRVRGAMGVECVLATIIGTGGPGRENIPVTGTNCGRGERIYPKQAPIVEGEREYTRNRHQLRKGRENIPVGGRRGAVRGSRGRRVTRQRLN